MTAQTPPRTRIALLLLTLGVVFLLLFQTAQAGPVFGGEDTTRTLTWSMSDSADLTFRGTAMENGSAVLAWAPETLDWSGGSDFAANGALDSSLTTSPSGIELTADTRNYITSGDFAAPGAWELLPTQNVNVIEEAAFEDAYTGHVSLATPNELYDSLDIPDAIWSSTSSSGSACIFIWTMPDHDGLGSMIRCTVTLGVPTGSFAGLERPSANWSAYDRLLLWVYAENPFPNSWSFRMNATVDGIETSTTLQPLRAEEWQEIVVDLSELGPNRDALTNIQFLVVGQTISDMNVFFDEIRLSKAKVFEETGRLRQSFAKASVTTSEIGSASLAFDYLVVNNSGVDAFEFSVNLSGDDGSYVSPIPVIGRGSWNHLSVDVSSISMAAGLYSLEFSIRIAVNAVAASNASVRIDNVRAEFPNRTAGSFLSSVIDFDVISQFSVLRWEGTIPPQTAAALRLRTGNQTNPSGPTWSEWHTWVSPGSYSPGSGPSRYLQIGFDLSTTNASRTPVIRSLRINVQHRSVTGSIETTYLLDDGSFRSWTSMQVDATVPGGGDVTLFVNGRNGWDRVPSNGVLSEGRPKAISWRVNLTTSIGMATPELSSVALTYQVSTLADYAAGTLLNPYVLAGLTAAAVFGSVGYRVVRRRSFAVDDLFVISREGRLMMHNTRRMRPDRDEDILSGMLTAILAFVKDSDPEGNGELHHFKVGDRTTMLEKGSHAYVAAVYSGRVPRWAAKDLRRLNQDLESRFGPAFADWSGDPEDLQGLKEFTSRFVTRVRYRPPNGANGANGRTA